MFKTTPSVRLTGVMGHPRKVVIALVLVALALCITACGSGSEGPSDSTASGSSDNGPTSTNASTAANESPSDGTTAGEAEDDGGEGEPAPNDPYGEVSSRSATFDEKGQTLKHLPEFGDEASSSERGEAQETLQAYLRASGAGDWAKGCDYIAQSIELQVEQIAKQIEDQSCGGALQKLATISKSNFPDDTDVAVTSMRIKKGDAAGAGAGFALIHGSNGKDYWVAMKVEGAEWKLLTVVPQPFR
jgi:hypothetical protein